MRVLRVGDEIFAAFPETVLGVVTAYGIDNTSDDPAILAGLRQEEERVRQRLAGIQISEHPHIAPWREAYRRFGAKPKDYPSSVENLVRRVLKGQSLPRINPLHPSLPVSVGRISPRSRAPSQTRGARWQRRRSDMKALFVGCLFAVILGLAAAGPAAGSATKCQMRFSLSGWSAFYKVSHGQGTITCDNGQKARVTLEGHGGGLTAGKTKITDGTGKFSEVSDISELFGSYVSAGAEAGAVKSTTATAMTKGDVSLALAGKGTGFNLGVSFGKLTITKK